MPMAEVTETNHFCKDLVSASTSTLCHLRLDSDDTRPESYVRMFTSTSSFVHWTAEDGQNQECLKPEANEVHFRVTTWKAASHA